MSVERVWDGKLFIGTVEYDGLHDRITAYSIHCGRPDQSFADHDVAERWVRDQHRKHLENRPLKPSV